MDYKKLHEETLTALQQMVSEGKITEEIARSICADFVKESEDERIRKEIIQSIQDNMCVIHKDKCIAWLEKQGEQPNKVSIWKHWKDGIAGNGDGKLVYLVKSGNTYRLSSCLGFECDYIELSELDKLCVKKQGEQKHHLELKAGHWYFCHQAYCERADILTVKEGERFQCEKDGVVKGLVIKEPAKYFTECDAPAPMEVEQNPAWSEGDVAMLDSAIAFVKHSAFKTIGKGKNNVIAWLKSLKERYTWKPSDEQIESLQESIGIVGVLTPRGEYLRELLEQLKKLKER